MPLFNLQVRMVGEVPIKPVIKLLFRRWWLFDSHEFAVRTHRTEGAEAMKGNRSESEKKGTFQKDGSENPTGESTIRNNGGTLVCGEDGTLPQDG